MSLTLAGESLADFAGALRQLRRRHARERNDTPLTYRELAAKSGYSHGRIGDYLTGKALPSTDRLDVLAMLLGASEDERRAFATARDRLEEQLRYRPAATAPERPAAVGGLPFDLPLVAELFDQLAPARYRVTRKSLRAVIAGAPDGGPVQRRRDATLTWTIELVNAGPEPLPQVELPLAGEVPVEDGELQVRIGAARFEHELVRAARVRQQPGFTPTIVLNMPHPGLAPGAQITLGYSYTWPALAHAFADRWFVVTAGMPAGAQVDLTLAYPVADPQTARAELIRRDPGQWRAEPLGALIPRAGEEWTVTLTHTVRAGEYAVLVHTNRAESADQAAGGA